MLDALISMGGLSLLFTSTNSLSTSVNLLFFWLTWTTLLLSHPPLRIELIGTAIIRFIFFWLPSLLFLAFDTLLPSLSTTIKLQRTRGVATTHAHLIKRFRVAALAGANMALGIALQAAVEYLFIHVIGRKSALRIASTLPLPGELLWGVSRGIVFREAAVYYVHRYVLHGEGWWAGVHRGWQHSVEAPWSVVAHYDHPVCNVLVRWVPTYGAAVLFRFHLLTWFLFLAVVSVEEAVTYSGYTAVWSMLGGATKRTDRHFREKGNGNYSPWGVLDWVHGTTVGGSVKEDAKEAVEEHRERKERRRREDTAD